MVDSVTFVQPHQLYETGLMPDWQTNVSLTQEKEGQIRSFKLRHLPNGYLAQGNDSAILHSASLPRLLYGHNGKLIPNQADLDAGLNLLKAEAAQIGRPTTDTFHFSRVDLVWHFRGDTADYIRAHRECRHSRIRSDPIQYEQRSLAFGGSEARITIYDKTLERYGRNGDIVRVEVQLRGRRLKEELGEGNPVTSLDFMMGYTAYRRVLLGLIPATIPKVSNIAELLALTERENIKIGGASLFDIFTASKSAKTKRRYQQQMAALRPRVHNIDWKQLLPADGPPPAIDFEEQ